AEAIHRASYGEADCFVAEPVIGRAFARPVGSSHEGGLPTYSDFLKLIPDLQKYCLTSAPNHLHSPRIPPRQEGRSANRHQRGARDARDAGGLTRRVRPKRTAKPRGPVPPTLGASPETMIFRRRRLSSPVLRGDRGISRNTIARGMPVDPAEPVVTAACVFCCRRAMGEAITRHSPRPPFHEGHQRGITRARSRRGNAESRRSLLSSRASEQGERDPRPITTGRRFGRAGATSCSGDERRWQWVPARASLGRDDERLFEIRIRNERRRYR